MEKICEIEEKTNNIGTFGKSETLTRDILLFTVGFLLTRCHLLFGAHPLGLAFLAALPVGVWSALVGAAIEALTASGYYRIIPAFIDTSLTNKYTFDTESAKVISLIGEKMYIELAAPFNANMAFTFDNLLNNAKPGKDIASYYAKNEKKDLKLMEEINSLYGAEHE
jgi:hypothetical protein